MYFKNKQLNEVFLRQGFVVLDLASNEKISQLSDIYSTFFKDNQPGFYSSSFIENNESRTEINRQIQAVLTDEISGVCEPHKSLGACFLTKNNEVFGEMPPHQDWTIVEEPDFHAVTIWIPLQDVDYNNGALQVIPGSHLFSKALRSPSLEDPLRFLYDEIKSDLVTIPLKKGQAIAFSHALIHASPANRSQQIRIAATYGFIPQKADLVFYHKNEDNLLEKYQIDTDFFERYNRQIGKRPEWLQAFSISEDNQNLESKESYQKFKSNYSIQNAMDQYKMIPILQDANKQQFFEENGFIVLPVLNQEQVEALKKYYFSSPIAAEKHEGFHVSMDSKDKDFCKKTRDFVWEIALPEMKGHLKDFKPFVASFTAKEPSPKGIVPPHQDWSFAGNEQDGFCSITCWIALVDTTLENGALGVIPGSHKIMQNHRPSPSPQTPVPLAKHMFPLFPFTQLIEMKAGEMLMFDNRTFHASPPNITDETRLAVGIGITQQTATLVHYYLKPDSQCKKLLKYTVDEDFFLNYDNARLSAMYNDKKLIEGYGEPDELDYTFDDWDTETMVDAVKNLGNKVNLELKNQMDKLFPQQYETEKEEFNQPENKQESTIDERTFFQKYTPLNIYREIKCKLGLN